MKSLLYYAFGVFRLEKRQNSTVYVVVVYHNFPKCFVHPVQTVNVHSNGFGIRFDCSFATTLYVIFSAIRTYELRYMKSISFAL